MHLVNIFTGLLLLSLIDNSCSLAGEKLLEAPIDLSLEVLDFIPHFKWRRPHSWPNKTIGYDVYKCWDLFDCTDQYDWSELSNSSCSCNATHDLFGHCRCNMDDIGQFCGEIRIRERFTPRCNCQSCSCSDWAITSPFCLQTSSLLTAPILKFDELGPRSSRVYSHLPSHRFMCYFGEVHHYMFAAVLGKGNNSICGEENAALEHFWQKKLTKIEVEPNMNDCETNLLGTASWNVNALQPDAEYCIYGWYNTDVAYNPHSSSKGYLRVRLQSNTANEAVPWIIVATVSLILIIVSVVTACKVHNYLNVGYNKDMPSNLVQFEEDITKQSFSESHISRFLSESTDISTAEQVDELQCLHSLTKARDNVAHGEVPSTLASTVTVLPEYVQSDAMFASTMPDQEKTDFEPNKKLAIVRLICRDDGYNEVIIEESPPEATN